MQKLDATSSEAKSADLVADNIEQLKALFPELITEGPNGAAVNVDVLKTLVGDQTATDAEEKYGLNWHGKRRARQLALTPSTGTLRPCPDESVDWDTTNNLMIEGDNLEVLKLLQKSYAGKVKLIYIDPPYNTGKDFVYPDKFQDNINNYLEVTGQLDGRQKKSSNAEASGRFHTDWLNMIYPRLRAARTLLAPDGIVLVSIDDTEVANLRSVLDSIFGEENFEAALIWEGGRKNDSRRVSVGHDYILVYARDSSLLQSQDVKWRERKTGLDQIYAKADELRTLHKGDFSAASTALQSWFKGLPDGSPSKEHSHYKMVDARGVWYGDNMSSPNPRPNLTFEWNGYAPPANGWRYDRAAMARLDTEGLLIYPESKEQRIQYKRYLHQTETWSPSSVFYKDRRAASKSLTSLMGEDVFDFPKDVDVVARMLSTMAAKDALVMDFFAGSGTTAHAVWQRNAEDGGSRRFIVVQLPEPLDPDVKEQAAAAAYCDRLNKPRNIAELTKERLRRASGQVQSLTNSNGDFGFRVFRLASSNIRAWNPQLGDLEQSLFANQDHLLEGRTDSDVLYELLLKLGIDLCVGIEHRTVIGKEVHAIGGGVLMACLATNIAATEVEAAALGIVNWHKELAPAGDTTCVFRDSAFADDVAKTNMAAILNQHGIQTVRSL
ncbi:site-specific DNA-methyltransferase [Variovorax sp. 2RAF20]